LILGAPAGAELLWHWEDAFDDAEQAKLRAWVGTVAEKVEEAIAPYPFDVHIHFYRSSAAAPVPWANTIRSRRQGVNVHVNPHFARDELLADWTVYHELAHLFLPFLGRQQSWFAEGFASYMQYQLMHFAGVLSTEDMWARYREKIGRAASRYDMPDRNFIEAARVLRARREYPTQYWGGAVYFLRVDAKLRALGTSVPEVVSEFVACCRFEPQDLEALVETLDRLAGAPVFSEELADFQRASGFPVYSGLLH
jgi:hypothetical protein